MTNHYPNEQDAEMKAKEGSFVAQVGGDHYQTEYQHWSWAIDAGLGYLDGCATKYVSRWWKKNGLQDLLKARTYVEKMIVDFDKVFALAIEPPDDIDEINERFVKANKLPALEADFCICMSEWVDLKDLEIALGVLDAIITKAKNVAGGPAPIAAPTLAGGAVSPALALPYGAAQGIAGQGAASNRTTDVHGSGHPAPFGYEDGA